MKNLDKLLTEDFIVEQHINQQKSIAQIAKELGTYPNKIRRAAIGYGIETRNKSEAQSLVLSQGKRSHPTKGKKHSAATKMKISDKVSDSWQNLSAKERKRRSEIGKQQWDNMSEEERIDFHYKAHQAVREAARSGSKLEKYLFDELIGRGYNAEFHKEMFLENQKLHLDIWMPKLNTAIEVDGPSHSKDIWGRKVLERNKRADTEKNGLLIARGCCVIRIKQTKNISLKYQRTVLEQLIEALEAINKKFPGKGQRLVELIN